MIKKLDNAGLGYYVNSVDTKQKLGMVLTVVCGLCFLFVYRKDSSTTFSLPCSRPSI